MVSHRGEREIPSPRQNSERTPVARGSEVRFQWLSWSMETLWATSKGTGEVERAEQSLHGRRKDTDRPV